MAARPFRMVCNSDMRVAEVCQFCKLDEAGESLMRSAMSQLNLSTRGYHRVLKLAHMIANLAGYADIQSVDLAEALQYRPKSMLGQKYSLDEYQIKGSKNDCYM